MAKIEKYQIKDIYTIGSALGIVERGSHGDELHLLVSALTGKEGVSELSRTEAARVIAELKRRMTIGGGQAVRRVPKNHEERPGGISAGQQRMVWALMYQLAAQDEQRSQATLGERLCGIVRKELGIDASPRDPMQWVSAAQGFRLIECLKGYAANAREKRLRDEAQ